MKQKRTWCKYGDCSLEKLEFEFKILNKIWNKLEKNWANPKDIEDVYRVYPLLDTTAALSRKILSYNEKNEKKYNIEIIEPTYKRVVNTKKYLYCDEYDFFNGNKKIISLSDVVSTFLHASTYVYMDTRKNINDNIDTFKIYVYVETDQRSQYVNVKNYIDAIGNLIKDKIK